MPHRFERIRRALPSLALFAVNAVWAIPAVFAMRLVRPWLRVRAGVLRHERVGHFVLDAALYLADRDLQRQRERTVDLLWFPHPTANEQWERIVRRTFVSGWWVRYLVPFNRRVAGSADHTLPSTHHSRDIGGLLQKSSACFAFLPEEEEAAKHWLGKRGWRDGEPFVCLLVRDSAYLSSHPMHSNLDWSYHDYRDSDIANYVEAVAALVERGYWVIRMGKTMHKRLPFAHPKVIDYPFVDDQDDLLDIWLSARCAFFVSTGSGVDTVPVAYRRPVVFVNFNPFGNILSYANNICVPKHLFWRATGRALTLREHYTHADLTYSHEYDAAGIELKELSATEIKAAVIEGEARYAGTWVDSEQNMSRQRRFWETLHAWPQFHTRHGYMHPDARVGSAWLEAMGDVFVE